MQDYNNKRIYNITRKSTDVKYYVKAAKGGREVVLRYFFCIYQKYQRQMPFKVSEGHDTASCETIAVVSIGTFIL